MSGRPNIVLVHGAFADGSRWSVVVDRLIDGRGFGWLPEDHECQQ